METSVMETSVMETSVMETSIMEKQKQVYNFSCGKCKKKITYNSKDIVRCPECGYRILFKERTLNYIEYSTN